MNTKLSMVAAATLAISLAPAAYAQDMSGDDQQFSGVYVGASGGYDIQTNDGTSRLQFDRNGDGTFTDTVTTAAGANAFSPGFCGGRVNSALAADGCRNDRDGASYYGRIGFDKQSGMIVLGAYGEFGRSKIRDYASGFSTTPASYTFERSLRWEASVRARAGLAAGSGTPFGTGLFYVTGGVGYADIRHRFSTSNTANAFAGNGGGKKRFGYVAGGGIEKPLSDHISIGMEYTYHDYNDDRYFVRVTQGTAPATNPFVLAPNTAGTSIRRDDENFRWHSLRGTVNFRF